MRAERGRDLDGTLPAADNKALGDEPGARERGINHAHILWNGFAAGHCLVAARLFQLRETFPTSREAGLCYPAG